MNDLSFGYLNHSELFSVDKIKQLLHSEKIEEVALAQFLQIWLNDDDFIIQRTSGSTGPAKELKLSKRSMKASAKLTLNYLNIQPSETAHLCLPLDYIAGKMMVVRALTGGLNLVYSSPKGTPKIPKTNIALSAMVPMQLENLIDEHIDFHLIQNLIIGGAAINLSLEQKLKNVQSKIFATYGMAETCSHVALQRLNGENPDEAFQLLDGISAQTDKEGRLVITAPHLATEPFLTSDLVEIASERSFKWIGRADNIINSGGIKINPTEIEYEIQPVIGKNCIILGIPDEKLGQKLILVVETQGTEMSEEMILQQINSHLTNFQRPKKVYLMQTFPRNTSMKIDRISILNLFLRN